MKSLAVLYRPQTFDEIIGQKSIIKILKRQIELNQFLNCYLFCGPSGDGKTTTARAFAKAINNNRGELIEIDGASNNGVDNIKSIIKSASERSVDSEYKIYIIDECFDGNSLVKTSKGYKKISKIKCGETVANLTGYSKVTHVYKHKVEKNRLNYVNLSNGSRILCTKDHLFLTTNGWINAKNLVKGDEIIVHSNLSKLWERDKNISKKPEILFEQMPGGLEDSTPSTESCEGKDLRDMWQAICRKYSINEYENLFESMQGKINIAIREDNMELGVWDGIKEIILRKDAKKQSNVKSRQYREDETDEIFTWNTSSEIQKEGWKWSVYKTATEAFSCIERFMSAGISNKNRILRKTKSRKISIGVQSRPWVRKEKTSDRGGWCFPSLEKYYCKRYKETEMSERVRVDSVEIYESGDRSESGKRSRNYTFLYDLEIEGHPSYTVHDVIVHNCHALTNQAWQAFLKCIEEPPKYTVFIFCTTDPQKIPQTILNRVQRFNFTRIPQELIRDRLAYVCKCEGFTNFEESIDFISKIANGGMRDALAYLDKASAYDTNLDINNVLEALGNYSYNTFFDLTNAIIDVNEKIILNIIDDFFNSGKDLKLFIEQYLDFILDIAKYCLFKDISVTKLPNSLEKPKDDQDTRCVQYVTGIEHNRQYFNKLVNKIFDIKNCIKGDASIKTTISIMLLQFTRGE